MLFFITILVLLFSVSTALAGQGAALDRGTCDHRSLGLRELVAEGLGWAAFSCP